MHVHSSLHEGSPINPKAAGVSSPAADLPKPTPCGISQKPRCDGQWHGQNDAIHPGHCCRYQVKDESKWLLSVLANNVDKNYWNHIGLGKMHRVCFFHWFQLSGNRL
ncbi:hypothetical protein Y1Q_0009521 [Alligator mississippiensis]|uniref:Uncharacterized protein n=1 Tax=Alligator mississippiensis TaxID=8496 RepID=A0A151NUL9_ALLMI|nr:hypothetical protein Y1Q_0009521 [Alligator mississippiensis]